MLKEKVVKKNKLGTLIIVIIVLSILFMLNKSIHKKIFENEFFNFHSQLVIEFQGGTGKNPTIDNIIKVVKTSSKISELSTFLDENQEFESNKDLCRYFEVTRRMIRILSRIDNSEELTIEERLEYSDISDEFLWLDIGRN